MGMSELHQGWWDPKLCSSRGWGQGRQGQPLYPIVLLHGGAEGG